MFPFFLLFLGGIVVTFGDIAMKYWIETDRFLFYAIGFTIYFFGLNFLVYSFKYKNMAVASAIFVTINIIILAIAGWILFKEKLNTMQIIGIFLGITSIVILEIAES